MDGYLLTESYLDVFDYVDMRSLWSIQRKHDIADHERKFIKWIQLEPRNNARQRPHVSTAGRRVVHLCWSDSTTTGSNNEVANHWLFCVHPVPEQR